MMIKRKQKKYMTLIETLTAAAILSVILTVLFGFFKQLSDLQTLTEYKQQESFQMRYVESRLSYLFQRLVNENEISKRRFYFYSQPGERGISNSPSLIFTADNGVRKDPHFSGDVLSRLYIDAHDNLCLAIWPLYGENPKTEIQKEVLLPHVKQMSFEFYMPPEKSPSKQTITGSQIDTDRSQPTPDLWSDQWLKTYQQMPAILKIKLIVSDEGDPTIKKKERKSEEKELLFAFVLPTSKNVIHYPMD